MRRVACLVVLALAGAGTAALLAATTASAWDYSNLPSDCHNEGWVFDQGVLEYVAYFRCDGVAAHFNYGTAQPPAAPTDPSFQGNLDTFVGTYYTAPATTTAAPATTTTTTAAATTTAPATTATTPPVTTTITQTVTIPTATQTIAVTTAVSAVEQSLQDQINALAAQLKAVTDRVTRLEKAGDASWLAFQQAVAGGATIADAAAQARGTWLNVVYQLGAFAPA